MRIDSCFKSVITGRVRFALIDTMHIRLPYFFHLMGAVPVHVSALASAVVRVLGGRCLPVFESIGREQYVLMMRQTKLLCHGPYALNSRPSSACISATKNQRN